MMKLERDWTADAACADTDTPDAFHASKKTARLAVRAAKQLCKRCPVQQQCLDDALERDDRFGIWGGLDEVERSFLRRRGRHT